MFWRCGGGGGEGEGGRKRARRRGARTQTKEKTQTTRCLVAFSRQFFFFLSFFLVGCCCCVGCFRFLSPSVVFRCLLLGLILRLAHTSVAPLFLPLHCCVLSSLSSPLRFCCVYLSLFPSVVLMSKWSWLCVCLCLCAAAADEKHPPRTHAPTTLGHHFRPSPLNRFFNCVFFSIVIVERGPYRNTKHHEFLLP